MSLDLKPALDWYVSQGTPATDGQRICSSRDVFLARLDGFARELARQNFSPNVYSLLLAVMGEIGVNCFDHNIGKWHDAAGCWFERDLSNNIVEVVIADRGQGVFESLRGVHSRFTTAQEALDAAFKELISGRYPERRGNGLDFVRTKVVAEAQRGLVSLSDGARFSCGNLGSAIAGRIDEAANGTRVLGRGTFVVLQWALS